MGMSKELWDSLEAIEESINKIVCLKQVLTLHSISNPDMMEILEALITEFSDKQKEVWNQVREVCRQVEKLGGHEYDYKFMYEELKDETADLEKQYHELYEEKVALEKKFDDLTQKYENLVFYDSYKES